MDLAGSPLSSKSRVTHRTLTVVRGESPVNNPAIKEIERHFNRLGALMHAVLVKYSKDHRSFLMLGQ
jgi:hypothetical protein